ncbi:MAG: 16S rRNA (guanine(966)-N(2))-methyltransferase RsmD [Bdellovibrionaceae bacterium]|nr:16S rRNA (guanine(966)-N(2))-methyltransferase RsmD [Pseudobdellovibrionaceae bacterium]|tara:strand:+ start:2133 stop:2738 length:606 start_codon:yes stop_codon:yes gene_type:complete
MRIISGKYKGHRLVAFKASHIRPTTDRVKESLFNKWTSYVDGAQVLDLFCGTGSLGLEALSRGAAHVDFVDANEKSLSILRENVKKLGVEESFKIIRKDALSFLKGSKSQYDLILIDPPFTKVMADQVLSQLSSSEVLKEGGLVAIESGTKENIEVSYGSLIRYDRKEFGDKALNLYELRTLPERTGPDEENTDDIAKSSL